MLREFFRKLRTLYLGKEDLETVKRDLQRALLLADVDVATVREVSKKVEELFVEKISPGESRKMHVIRGIYSLLREILGEKRSFEFSRGKIVLLGLFGSGKTTTAVKLALWLKKRGKKVCVVTRDTERPAAREQLEDLASRVGVTYGEGCPVTIVDTPGGDALDEETLERMRGFAEEGDFVFLVIPADVGQYAGKMAEKLREVVDGIIITKMDGSAKGGGALAACKNAGVPVYFIGTGERPEDFQEFDPDSYLKRILGVPDLKEVAKEVKIPQEFTFREFYAQIREAKGRNLREMASMLGIPPSQIEEAEERFKKYDAIYKSMTEQERDHPEILNASRIRRIAKGSGTREEDVRAMIRDYKRAKKLMKMVKGRGLQRLLRRMGPW